MNAELVFLIARSDARGIALDEKSGKLLTAIWLDDFCKDRIQTRNAAVRDPLLFTIECVMRAIGREYCPRPDVHCVRTGTCFRQSVCADQFASSELGQV